MYETFKIKILLWWGLWKKRNMKIKGEKNKNESEKKEKIVTKKRDESPNLFKFLLFNYCNFELL